MKDDLRAAFEELTPPAHPSLSASIREAVAAGRRPRPVRRPWLAPAVATLLVLLVVVVGIRLQPTRSPGLAIPAQPPWKLSRFSLGAQVAWVNLGSQLVAYDSRGKVVSVIGSSGGMRSPDGAMVYISEPTGLVAYDAATGNVTGSYPPVSSHVWGTDFSPDGRYLALLLGGSGDTRLQVINLQTGDSVSVRVPTSTGAATPGLSGGPGSWGLPVFGADSSHVYVITDWGGPTRVTAFEVSGGKITQLLSAVDGQAGKTLPSCNGPSLAPKIVADGATMVAFCHSSGLVWFIDLHTLSQEAVVNSHQRNPFWFSPIFTPDGKRLYLHQWPGFGDSMTMIDLVTRKLYGPAPTPQSTDQPGIFASLLTTAFAGGVASTVPLSPDGQELYSATPDGVLELRMPDLKVLAKLGRGYNFDEVWVSGDGLTVYGLAGGGKQLVIMNGSGAVAINLPSPALGFIASEHG